MSSVWLMRPMSLLWALLFAAPVFAQAVPDEGELLFRGVRVLDTVRGTLGAPTDVLVRGRHIDAIGAAATPAAIAAENAAMVFSGCRELAPRCAQICMSRPLVGSLSPGVGPSSLSHHRSRGTSLTP